jgi:hypothetical protein
MFIHPARYIRGMGAIVIAPIPLMYLAGLVGL